MKNIFKSVHALGATLITFGSLAGGANAAVILTVSERVEGGVKIVASGSINTAGFTHVFDAGAQHINTFSISSTNVTINGSVGNLELWYSAGATYAMPTIAASNLTFSSYGTFGHGLNVDSLSRFGVFAADGFADDNLPPSGQTVYSFDFEGYSPIYELDRFVDGTVIWDSNGASAGGETITLRVVPEPSSAIFLGGAFLAIAFSRRR